MAKLRVTRKITHKKNAKGVKQLLVHLPAPVVEAWGDTTQIEWELDDRDLTKIVARPVT